LIDAAGADADIADAVLMLMLILLSN